MIIRNIMFSGFAAAIFAGVCGAANAASVELISKPYADSNLQAKLTAGDNIAIDSQTNTISATGLATTTYVDAELAKKQNELQLGENLQWVEGKLDTKGIATADGLAELESKVNNAAQKTYVDEELAKKADTTALESAVADLEAAIALKQDGGDYLVEADLSELNAAVEALKTEKATVASVTALQSAIDALGDTYATDAELTAAINEVKGLIPTVPTVVSAFDNDAGYITNAALADYAKSADVYTKGEVDTAIAAIEEYDDTALAGRVKTLEDAGYQTATEVEGAITTATADLATKSEVNAVSTSLGEVKATADAAASKTYVDEELAKKQNELQLGENLQWVDGKLDTKGIATADGLAELESKVNNAAQKTEVATDIAAALAEAKQYADDNDADTIYDDTALAGRVKTLEDAGYQTATEVEGAITTATADLATKSEVNAVSTSLGEYKTSNDAAVASKANSADVYTKGEVDAAIAAIEEYDDTALAGRVTANESAIATNTSGIEANAGAIEALQNAGYVSGVKTAGSYLVNFDASGNASYAPVAILDAAGAPIDLTTDAVK